MAGFDPRAYTDQVLKPLRRRLPHLPDDLLTRYAVDLTMDTAALRDRIASVVRLWNKTALKAGPTGLVCQQLLREHDELERGGSAGLNNPQWWQAWARTRHRKLDSDIAELGALLRASHGELGVITHNQLRAAAAAHPGLGDTEITAASKAAGLRIVQPVELPAEAGMSGRFESLASTLLAAGIDSIPRLLFPELSSFGLLGGFTSTPGDGDTTLSQHVAEQRAVALDTMPDSPANRAQREAVGILVTEAKNGTDLTALALFHLLGEVRDTYAHGAQSRTLFTLLTRRGLRSADAGRIVVSVLAESALISTRSGSARSGPDPLTAVTELLSGGKLLAAHQLATTLPGPAGEQARDAVRRQRELVENLRREAAEDLHAGRDEQARWRLREALRLARDLPELAAELAMVPAAPVASVTANPDGAGVHISWRPAPDHDAATTFRVIGREGRPPAHVEDGREIPTGSNGFSANAVSVNDEAPPVGRPVTYAVFARTAGGPWSLPVRAEVQVVPPVTDVVVEGGRDRINARWRIHPDVAVVEVHRSEVVDMHRTVGIPEGRGEPITVQRNRGFCDETAVDGVGYCYALIACYPRPDGAGALCSAPVVVRGAIRPEARPVAALTATAAPGADLAVRLSWSQRPGSEIVIRRSPQACPWEYGQVVALTELASYGEELDGTFTAKGESVTLLAQVPPGRSYCVPFTLDIDGAIRGQDAVVDLADPVRRLRAQRFGDDIRITWCWPDGVSAAEVQWAGGSRRITAAQYRDEGGCQLRGVPAVSRVEVGAVLLGAGGECCSSMTSVLVEQRLPQLSYQLRRRGTRLTGGVRCVVTVAGAQPVAGVTIIVVAAAGHAMPTSPGAGVELLRQRVMIDPAAPVVLEAPVPRLPRPYWLRCFLADGAPVQLIDPPLRQLKVS
ncbi:MAG: hypothetical protein ACRDTX_24490 [Pseudonocardiaceae bacterium]